MAIKASIASDFSLYWNNKDKFNYIEITPYEPTNVYLDSSKKFYFKFYVSDINDALNQEKGDVIIYFKSTISATIYI